MICAMDNPSGSAPFTIASTMSGARLFKPSTRITYGGFKPSFAAKVLFVKALFPTKVGKKVEGVGAGRNVGFGITRSCN